MALVARASAPPAAAAAALVPLAPGAVPPTPRGHNGHEFTPAVINKSLCLARTWGDGRGGQCCRQRLATGSFCMAHAKDEKWKVHGHVELKVPEKKLNDFRKEWIRRASGVEPKPRGPRPRHSAGAHASEVGGVIEIRDDEEDDGLSHCSFDSFDDEALPAASGLLAGAGGSPALQPRSFGRGVIAGAEAVAAHFDFWRREETDGGVAESAAPGTPPAQSGRRVRRLESDPNLPELPAPKRLRKVNAATAPEVKVATEASAANAASAASVVPELECGSFETFGVPENGRRRLMPLMERWGPARRGQILGLWTFLGDGATRPVCTPTLQLWGPRGSGKSAILSDYLDSLSIRSVWLDCACFVAIGELQARLAELLRRLAVTSPEKSGDAGTSGATPAAVEGSAEVPEALRRGMPMGRQLRGVDRMENTMGASLDHLASCTEGHAQVVVVLDNAQELLRLGTHAAELLALPEVLQHGSHLSVVAVSPRPLSDLGLLSAHRDPAAVAFAAYSDSEAGDILMKVLGRVPSDPKLQSHLHAIVSHGLLKFALPSLGRDLRDLLSVGTEVLLDRSGRLREVAAHAGGSTSAFMDELQRRVQKAIEARVGMGGAEGVCEQTDIEGAARGAAAAVAARQLTKAEKRLILAAYLAAYVQKEDDLQLFLPESQRRKARRNAGATAARRRQDDDQPSFTRAPRPAPLARMLAIYHRLARQPHLLGNQLFETLSRLRAAGLLLLDRTGGQGGDDARVICRVDLPLVKVCAGELDVNLAEYLCGY
eukprot:TRINITY_DN13321_c0_g1_i1.p1 TRINITY_DN13321_c0_g1~~TRINITY_DN13321_c0_g1_i1.p1  ORF type:complete len:772 (-),score=174.41 TRINITY_DN13321_c0_g1_i1:145-2460(-)